ncbi:ribonuclease J [Lachnoclostridium phytofermentans]|uniref:Ribonuclease J n=1 Tax=Lachnoclostridium phytofermentans (strain ATCC 700394 / DSM 18823 / ISDg) TaxID=357809 RepID=A9KKS3_LACP7|nr:ribonuclease J [Lachnoclostridium phytofermentans]ABX42655.1 beta-lactamase domain protein [Lachnoclostridium phytofermentans ISDg]
MKGKENSKENNQENKNSQMEPGGVNRRNGNSDRNNRMRRKPRPFKVERAANNNKVELTVPVVETPEPDAKPAVKIIPLGGLGQIGMNITAFEYQDSIIVVDCGLAFPEDEMLGIDLVIPDITYLKDNIQKVKGFVITHGHEDHIGSLPYVIKDINVPIYGTKLTLGIIENKLKEHNLLKSTKRKVIKYGQSINLGCFRIEFIRTNHSIADAAALAIYSPAGIIVHTGDFKVDYTPVFGETIDLQKFGELGKKGVLALMCDSTNVMRPGYTMSERTVGKTFDNIFAENSKHRIIVATFASNVDRVQQIINSAVKYNRKVVIEGRSMVNIMTTASELGYITVPDNVLIDIEQMKNYTDEQLVLITTGSQGESMAALSRMAASIHRKVSITPGDTVIFSSTPIPGNEKNVSKIINELSMKGAKVIFQDTHVSGHACQEEIKLIYALTKPKFAIPVHGEFRHLKCHAELAQDMGVKKDNVVLLTSGDVLSLSEDRAKIVDHIPAQGILVDGLGVGDVGNIVLRDRQHLSENGLIIVVVTLEKFSNQVLSGPDIVSRGFVYVRESENLMEEARTVVNDALDKCLNKNMTDWGKIKNEIKDSLSDYLWKKMKRNPMILPIIMEV